MTRVIPGAMFLALLTAAVAAVATLGGGNTAAAATDATRAQAELRNANGERVGEATLVETAHGVLVHVTLTEAPAGPRALHIHETGRCEPPSFESAGDHFNPTDAEHGFKNPKGVHAGDLPNVHVPKDGRLEVELLAPNVTLSAGPNMLLDSDGSSLVLHDGVDDYQSDPAGEAGDRVACGVVQGG